MTGVFADAYYFLALVNSRDRAHHRSVAWSQANDKPIVTTEWIILEVANHLARAVNRRLFKRLYESVKADALTTVLPASHEMFARGIERYEQRPDKDWSLTDCISFVVMEHEGLHEALTGDHHFEQAGFVALLRDDTVS